MSGSLLRAGFNSQSPTKGSFAANDIELIKMIEIAAKLRKFSGVNFTVALEEKNACG